MSGRRKPRQGLVVRELRLYGNRWLTRRCYWTKDPRYAARFTCEDDAITFARRCGRRAYSLFPTSTLERYRTRIAEEVPQSRPQRVSRAASRWASKWDLPQE